MKADERNIIEEFRALAPARPRSASNDGASAGAALTFGVVPAVLIRVAQSVPSASLLPCVDFLPVGWSFSTMDVGGGRTKVFLNSVRGGYRTLEITLSPAPATRSGRVRHVRLRFRRGGGFGDRRGGQSRPRSGPSRGREQQVAGQYRIRVVDRRVRRIDDDWNRHPVEKEPAPR